MAVILKHDFTEDIDPNWLLEEGQMGVELFSGNTSGARLKVGDGVTPWSKLKYVGPDPALYGTDSMNYTSTIRRYKFAASYGFDIEGMNSIIYRSNLHQFFQAPGGGEDNGEAIVRISKDGVLPGTQWPKPLGSSSAPWASIWSLTGTVQTCERSSKDSIRYLSETVPSRSSEITLNTESVLDFVREIQPATFCYKNHDHTSDCDYQLGLIADDLLSNPLYKYIGVNQYDDELGRNRLGLQPMPLAVAALTTCKHLLEENDRLHTEIETLKSSVQQLQASLHI